MPNQKANQKSIPGFCGYACDKDGMVWSQITLAPCGRDKLGRISGKKRVLSGEWTQMKPRTNNRGYLTVNLRDDGGRKAPRLIHRLVLLTFSGPPKKGQETRHLDGDPKNNKLENLKWGTKKENQADCLRHGTRVHSEAQHLSKLNTKKVMLMRLLKKEFGWDGAKIHRTFGVVWGVHLTSIQRAVGGRTWKHI